MKSTSIDGVDGSYICPWISFIMFSCMGCKSKDLHLTGTGNRITSLKRNVNTYQKEKKLDFIKSIKNFVAIDDKVN